MLRLLTGEVLLKISEMFRIFLLYNRGLTNHQRILIKRVVMAVEHEIESRLQSLFE